MSSILVINAAGRETRVALVENGQIAEFYLERKKDKGIVGNIYKGRVTRVLPGMQAAFVDIGLDKAAFLYVTDVFYDPDLSRAQFELTEGEHDDAPEVPELADHPEEPLSHAAPETELGASEAPSLEPAAREESGADSPLNAAVQAEPAIVAPPLEPVPPMAASGDGTPVALPHAPPLESPVAVKAEGSAAELQVGPVETVSASLARDESPAAPVAPSAESDVRGERRAKDRQRYAREERERGRARHDDRFKNRKPARIEELLKVGQEVLVQVSKDPIGTKGARLTSHISIPGRHLVFMPTVDHVGISRRISNEKERRRLREIVDRLRPPGTGFIVRTVAENVPQEKLESDIRFLIGVWNECVRRNEKNPDPGLLYPDLDLILRATRDLFAHDVEKLVVDDRDEYERILGFIGPQDPELRDRVLLHEGEEPIFDAYGIEQEINRAVQRKVWLRSGGYLVIDQAEALTAVDVNSGRYVGKKSLEETITKINVEAAKEIAYQLRLRNIGGIIICDFIDMEKLSNRDKVFKTLQDALGRDKAKTNVLRISELGLVEMTRKRVRESIGRILHEDCPYCDGRGYVKTATTVAYEIFRYIRREAATFKEPILVINCSADVARLLQGEERQELRHLMDRFNKSIQVKAQQNYHPEQFDVYGKAVQGPELKETPFDARANASTEAVHAKSERS
ncbi:MAG TPA: Rne/Rng family ribonuclease [Myxococcaceae bacterium]|nr:Rne/Rng family ribonuclease [Myxococcaceae bacterium]